MKLFYFHLISHILQYKSDLYTRDNEGLGPLDVAMKDRSLLNNVPPAGKQIVIIIYSKIIPSV